MQIKLVFLFSPAKTFPELSLWKCQRRDSLILCRTNSQKCFPQPTTWKCHWSNRDRTKNQKPTVPWLSLTIDGNVTGQKILHHPWLFIKFSYIKLNTRKEILASQKKKMEKVRLSTQTHRNDWLLGLIFLSRHTLSLPYNHNLSHRHIGRWFVLEHQDRLGHAELQQTLTQYHSNTKSVAFYLQITVIPKDSYWICSL